MFDCNIVVNWIHSIGGILYNDRTKLLSLNGCYKIAQIQKFCFDYFIETHTYIAHKQVTVCLTTHTYFHVKQNTHQL